MLPWSLSTLDYRELGASDGDDSGVDKPAVMSGEGARGVRG